MTTPTRSGPSARALGLGLGFVADQLVGDPRHGHPVAGFGRLASALERRMWADSRRRGVAYVAVLVGATTSLGVLLERSCHSRPRQVLAVAAATWAVLGGAGLASEGEAMADLLRSDDLDGARTRLRHLCGRDAADLTDAEMARAVVESLAENTSDAVVAPLLWGAVAGVPGLVFYRAANTLDAMVGYRTARYRRFGWAAARLDDLVNVVPARCAAGLAAVLAPVAGGRTADAVEAWRRDAGRHPSPNAGQVEASFAGALGVRLGGLTSYAGETEDRPVLGRGREARTADVPAAIRLSRAVGVGAAVLASGLAAAPTPRRRR